MDEKPSELCHDDAGEHKSPLGWLRGLLANVNVLIIFRDKIFKILVNKC